MTCEKCGYKDKNEKEIFGKSLCLVCAKFAPSEKERFDSYINEKIDWKILDTFRTQKSGQKQKDGMAKKAKQGKIVTRAPFGYSIVDGKLEPNEKASKVHSLFKTFLNRNYSLNSLAKNFSLSLNGVKKILTNRTYLGEIKFDGKIYKGTHPKLISEEIFYAVQRKLRKKLRN